VHILYFSIVNHLFVQLTCVCDVDILMIFLQQRVDAHVSGVFYLLF